MSFKVAAPYTIYIPRPVTLPLAEAGGDLAPQPVYDFSPDYSL